MALAREQPFRARPARSLSPKGRCGKSIVGIRARAPRRWRWPSPQARRPREPGRPSSATDLGLAAVGELGVALERLLIVRPGQLVLGTRRTRRCRRRRHRRPRHRISNTDARRMAARLRERGSVLIHIGDRWPVGADVQLDIATGEWEGLGDGHGVLRSRRLDIQGGGRGSASRPVSSKSSCLAPAGRGRTRRVSAGPHPRRLVSRWPVVATGVDLAEPVVVYANRIVVASPGARAQVAWACGAVPPGSVRHACPPRT